MAKVQASKKNVCINSKCTIQFKWNILSIVMGVPPMAIGDMFHL